MYKYILIKETGIIRFLKTNDETFDEKRISAKDTITETQDAFNAIIKRNDVVFFDDYNSAYASSIKFKALFNAKNHIAITAMANTILVNIFTLYAVSAKDANIEMAKLLSALDELQTHQSTYVKTNEYGAYDPIALQDLVDIYDLMPDATKQHIKDNLEIYSWFEPKAPFMEFYKKIGGKIENFD